MFLLKNLINYPIRVEVDEHYSLTANRVPTFTSRLWTLNLDYYFNIIFMHTSLCITGKMGNLLRGILIFFF